MSDTPEKTKVSLLEKKIIKAMHMVRVNMPFLSELAAIVKPAIDNRVPTAGIFDSGRLLLNPVFATDLRFEDLMFVLAHEVFHLALRTNQRGRGQSRHLVNVAHDYIINDILSAELGCPVPAGGLVLEGARFKSLERLLHELEDAPLPAKAWTFVKSRRKPDDGALADSLRKAGLAPPLEDQIDSIETDVLPNDLEDELFPDERVEHGKRREEVEKAAVRSEALAVVSQASRTNAGKGNETGGTTEYRDALEVYYRPPWEMAIQSWFDALAPGDRSYARPSRRGAGRTDVVLPGRKRAGWMLNVILDTSGSMDTVLRYCLGTMMSFCEANNVETVRVLQCDTLVTRDEIVETAQLKNYKISGFGGSNLSPALAKLAQDPDVEAVVVITDGEIDYLREPPPYGVLWVLTEANGSFHPHYGKVILLDTSRDCR